MLLVWFAGIHQFLGFLKCYIETSYDRLRKRKVYTFSSFFNLHCDAETMVGALFNLPSISFPISIKQFCILRLCIPLDMRDERKMFSYCKYIWINIWYVVEGKDVVLGFMYHEILIHNSINKRPLGNVRIETNAYEHCLWTSSI